MIQDDTELQRTHEQLALLKDALAGLRDTPMNQDRFQLWSQPYLEHIEMLESKINEYVTAHAITTR